MADFHDAVIRVQREWNAWRTAEVSIDDLEDIHWRQPAGAPHPLLHAYVPRARIAERDIPHDFPGTPEPHRMRVCVLKRHLVPSVYAEIERRASAAALAS
jgi:hypothetical protein